MTIRSSHTHLFGAQGGGGPGCGGPGGGPEGADDGDSNAIRHNTTGGTVQVTTGQQDGQAVISVANTGPVIPPAEVTRLFRPFEHLATPRASNGHGHGLGLSIVAAIADAHHATIAAHAQPEGGLRVQVSFPGQPPETAPAEFDHLPSDAGGLRMSTTGQPR